MKTDDIKAAGNEIGRLTLAIESGRMAANRIRDRASRVRAVFFASARASDPHERIKQQRRDYAAVHREKVERENTGLLVEELAELRAYLKKHGAAPEVDLDTLGL